jgi:dTDP-4-amino-4,6-dideoxygalactose transaminase
LVVTNDDALARRIYLFINKAWGYGDEHPDHYFLALNYRMSELAGSVAVAQLDKLQATVSRRRSLAERLTQRLSTVPELLTPAILPNAEHSYWKYCVRAGDALSSEAVVDMAALLKQRGVVTMPRYIQKPAFMCEVFQKRRTFGNSGYPFTIARAQALDYRQQAYPGTMRALERVLVVPWNDRYSAEDVDYIGDALAWAAQMVAETVRL